MNKSLYDRAQKHVQKGQWQKAIELMKEVHLSDRGDPIITLRLGDLLKKTGSDKEAADFYFKTANIFADNGEITKAAATYKMILRLDPSLAGVQEQLDRLAARREAVQPSALPPPSQALSMGMDAQKIEASSVSPPGGNGSGTQPMEVYYGPAEKEASGDAGDGEYETLSGVVPLGETVGMEKDFEAPGDAVDEGPREAMAAGLPVKPDMEEAADVKPLSGGPAEMFTDFARDAHEPSGGEPQVKPSRPAKAPERKDAGPLMGLEEDELWELLGRMDRLTFGRGEAIVREGGTDDCIYIISSGRVGITTEKGGVVIKLAELGERDFFGEVAFLTGKPRTATVTALETTTVMELARTHVDDLIKKYPKVGRVLKMFHENRVADTISTMRTVSKGLI